MKINVDPSEFGDLIVLFLLDMMANPNSVVLKSNPKFAAIIKKMNSMGFKSPCMASFFATDAFLKQRYNAMRDIFEKKSGSQHIIYITQDSSYIKKLNSKGNVSKKESIKNKVKNIIKTALGVVSSGHRIDDRNLSILSEKVIIQLNKKDPDVLNDQ